MLFLFCKVCFFPKCNLWPFPVCFFLWPKISGKDSQHAQTAHCLLAASLRMAISYVIEHDFSLVLITPTLWLAQTKGFTLRVIFLVCFSVPKECADVVLARDKIKAAPSDVTPAQCEAKPDRCYWDMRVDNAGPKCYYKKGKIHWYTIDFFYKTGPTDFSYSKCNMMAEQATQKTNLCC